VTSSADPSSKPSSADPSVNPDLLITVSGPPGSGTTTVAQRVAGRLGLELVPGGEVFRAMAAERNMSLPEFGLYVADNPDVDVELDGRLARRARDGGAVVDSLRPQQPLESWAVDVVADQGIVEVGDPVDFHCSGDVPRFV